MKQTVMITGALSGLGIHLWKKFESEGHTVFSHQGRKHFDLTKVDDVKKLAHTAIKSDVKVLINNAAIVCPNKPLHEYEEQEILDMISVNLTAPVLLSYYMLEHLTDIININSMVGLETKQPRTLYSATKWGLRGFSNSLRAEVGEDQIPFILDVYPTNIKTTPEKQNAMDVHFVVDKIYNTYKEQSEHSLILDGRPKK